VLSAAQQQQQQQSCCANKQVRESERRASRRACFFCNTQLVPCSDQSRLNDAEILCSFAHCLSPNKWQCRNAFATFVSVLRKNEKKQKRSAGAERIQVGKSAARSSVSTLSIRRPRLQLTMQPCCKRHQTDVPTRYCTAAVDKRLYAVRAYTTADSAVSYLNYARIT